jgi:alkaline phosphatase D
MTAPFRRRTLIKAAGTALSALPLRGFAVTETRPVHFTHHVASGDPLADRVMLWTRLLPGDGAMRAVRCRWEIATTAEFTTLIASGTATATPERDYTVKVDAQGLKPGQSYCYRFVAEGVTSPVGCTRTLPVGDVSEFKLGVASCSNYPQGFFHAYREMAKLSSMPSCTWATTFTNTRWANT